jgi:prevent-host-death family protein
MPKAVSANEAKQRLGALVNWAVEQRDEVIVESHGKPKAVIMAYAEYEAVQQLREKARRKEALARLEQLRERANSRNQDLTEEQAMELADRFAHELFDELAAEGKIRFARDEQ